MEETSRPLETVRHDPDMFGQGGANGRVSPDLVDIVERWSRGHHDCETAVPGLGLFRREQPSPPVECMIEPSIVIVVQGAKRMWIGKDAYSYDASRFLITSLELPARSEVIEASPERPCLGLALRIDRAQLTDLISRGGAQGPLDRSNMAGIGLSDTTTGILAPVSRLLSLLDEPGAIPFLAPLVLREIHYRLLQSDQAHRLRQIASIDGHGFRISKAVDWIRAHYAQPMQIEHLAAMARMSTPSFYHHFRQLTTLSPLQYQKRLRLDEARRLMLTEQLDAANAAFQVGYESPSQFSREYSRAFGAPPKSDIQKLRSQARASFG
ncbi:Helix-turn-helix domain-containing protein [Kushneria avicenniae]|uniref:Helix-turn-helix domain-containing protein n=1 Tax=Kushneria avicenniae TaxID=402385 RepID=A0A1I1G518_9GAMM|nr:AraC family transcriptional regulator [Kushneria avicenniae]SFC06837.1 Helix-turn-helix domain-containing protein [Kushneria avicenniae]